MNKLGDNCIQNFHLPGIIVGYTVGNLVLRRRASGAVKREFRTYIRRYTSPNEKFEYGYPHSNALLQFRPQFELGSRIKPHVIQRDVTLLMTSNYFRQYIAGYTVANFLTLSNQTSRYKIKCIRMASMCEFGTYHIGRQRRLMLRPELSLPVHEYSKYGDLYQDSDLN